MNKKVYLENFGWPSTCPPLRLRSVSSLAQDAPKVSDKGIDLYDGKKSFYPNFWLAVGYVGSGWHWMC